MMGLWQVGFGLVVVLVVGMSEAQWRVRSTPNRRLAAFNSLSQMQVPQQPESRVPQRYGASNPMLSPQRFPSQISMQVPGMTGGKSVQDPLGVQSKQLLQGPKEKLTWTFPTLPEEPVQPEIPFELRHPISPSSVAAQCGEHSVYVEVIEDFFGTGKLLSASSFSLGGCSAIGEDLTTRVLIFESELHGCGSVPTVTDDEVVYTFSLVYTPQEISYGVPIVRSSGAVIGIECHYPRMHSVSSNVLKPTWIPYVATKVAEEHFVFSLKLMTDDWQFERPSNQYFMGDFINVEASVRPYNHVPVRVFLDSCLATATRDSTTVPRYSFIENNGCLIDAKFTGSGSRFLTRTRNDTLQFQLETFRFQQVNSGLVYITCVLKVATVSTPISLEQKACSFSPDGWLSADDSSDRVCGCCDSTCSIRSGRDQVVKALQWQRATVGPINVKEFGVGPL